ncbi:lachesin-like isoform X2 [Sitodiplosis mosellana]|uniref:lachesin-like isoform X2 n=1 Tax=Sitodiplosis mosellana TaxID=263140 RepID=UPI0024440FB8|nr:lachesin-like isoform X2 [Sitodiplosis mosellana]XP_055327128.1 lachesin-like isoform X2 [Sitodiplosis mosellana]
MCFPATVSLPLLLVLLACCIGVSNAFLNQRTKDTGYNTFDDTSTDFPSHNSITASKWNEPYFDNSIANNVSALVGKSAYLSCKVRNLGNKTVSWIRHRDIHILTVGTYTYTTDQRFQTAYHRDFNEWTLQIKWAQKRDAGVYECQISTIPIKSFSVRLNVVEPVATILGGQDLFVDKGSTINLTCTIRFGPEPPGHIFWYHENKEITAESPRGSVDIKRIYGEWTTSYLLIRNANIADSGVYTCAPAGGSQTSIKVHVFLHGERPEAMQTGTSTYFADKSYIMHTLLVAIIISIYNIFRDYNSSILIEHMPIDYIT